ncbi:type IV secretory system conjugative DNA transfer family protein [Tessaracoccus flavescens]|uniref:TraD/TraG TraM recognition site domain-containing protein n=1 Tax=Tessaracoccus flavescens TaxID=399497 RepID=A0A1Q2D2U5_9ACTN|nr:type IV secretory system conjugative DNA transfer family protein [Tessaracoccus flavescens]AQP52740.1 hypothetical protein BW733_17750 [Tessaracoccus flavescens]
MNLPFGLSLTTAVLILLGVLVLAALLAWVGGSIAGGRVDVDDLAQQRASSSRWATYKTVKADLGEPKQPDPRRLRLCELEGKPLYNPPLRSKLVMAPSGAGKSPRVVIPDVLRHDGPALVTSIKSDVVTLTRAAREKRGRVYVFAPAGGAEGSVKWSPLAHVISWADALDAARTIQECSKVDSVPNADREFWDAQARYLLSPLMYLAARQGRTMGDIASLVVGGEESERLVTNLLNEYDEDGPKFHWARFVMLEHKTKSSVLITAATVLEAWTHPRVAGTVNVRANDPGVLDLDELLTGEHTLYLVSPASEQSQFTPIYEALVNALTQRVEQAYHRVGLPLDPPLLLALDEAANIAPLRKLDYLASAGAGQGMLVLSVWQDEGQQEHIYGAAKARTIRSNHFTTVYLPGINDHTTLKNLSEQIGRDSLLQRSTSTSERGTSVTDGYHELDIAPVHMLRQLPKNQAIIISGPFPPIRGVIPAWYEDKKLRALVPDEVAASFDAFYKPTKKKAKATGPAREPIGDRLFGQPIKEPATETPLQESSRLSRDPLTGRPGVDEESVQGWFADDFRRRAQP